MPDVFAGRFELIDPIGTGGTGTVWRAWDRRLERYCAAKVLRQRHAGALLRFVREQGRRLDHPHILSPYGWAADDDQALLAMDLVGGGALSNLSADFGPLPERYVAELLRQLLEALAHIHEQGVVHRDVKPANLLLEATGVGTPSLRLTDFGIALALGEPRLTQQGTIVGTPGYLAPEILAGALPSIQQDLYAAGITAHQLLTAQEPAADESHPSRPPGTTSTVVWDVIEALLHPDPNKRIDSATASLALLKPALATPLPIPAHTRDNELIEVFDHLPPLPTRPTNLSTPTPHPATTSTPEPAQPAAHREGPDPSTRPRTDPTTTSSANAHPAPSHLAASEGPTGARVSSGQVSGVRMTGVRVSSVRVSSRRVSGERPNGGQPGGEPPNGGQPGGEPPNGGQPGGEKADGASAGGRRRRVLLAAGAGLAVAAIATTAVLIAQGDPGDNLRPTGGRTTPTTSPTTTLSATSTPPPVPTGSPNPNPDTEVKLGAPCGWQEAGTMETAANGVRVECRKQGSTYRWIRAT